MLQQNCGAWTWAPVTAPHLAAAAAAAAAVDPVAGASSASGGAEGAGGGVPLMRLSTTQGAATEANGAHNGAGAGAGGGGGVCELHQPLSSEQLSPHARSSLFVPAMGHVAALVALKRSVLFVHHHPPQQRLGSDRRLLALLTQVHRLGWRVSYAGAENYDPGPVRGRRVLEQMGIQVLTPIKGGESLVSFAKAQDASVVVLSLWFWGEQETLPARYLRLLRTRLPHAKLVIISDDVHHQRLMLAAEDEGRPPGKDVSKTREEELRWYFHADHVLTISHADKATILASLTRVRAMKGEHFSTLRHVYADGPLFPLDQRAPFADRHGLLFVGNLNNPTNLFGLRWFILSVWPIVRALDPTATLRVLGDLEGGATVSSGLPQLLKTAPGVEAMGFVTDEQLGGLLQQARVFIVPIRWATGILTKQTLAHVHGLPTVITPTAARHVAPASLDARGRGDAWSHALGRYELVRVALVATDPADFAAGVLQLHRNETLWTEVSMNAARFARSGGGGKGVCPSGVGDDWLGFWSKLQTSVCGGRF